MFADRAANDIECMVANGNPGARISWLLDGRNITDYVSYAIAAVLLLAFSAAVGTQCECCTNAVRTPCERRAHLRNTFNIYLLISRVWVPTASRSVRQELV